MSSRIVTIFFSGLGWWRWRRILASRWPRGPPCIIGRWHQCGALSWHSRWWTSKHGVHTNIVVASDKIYTNRYCRLEAIGKQRSVSRVTLYTAGHLHTAVPHCSHSRAPIVHTAVPRENNEHGCVYLRCRAVCKLPGCVEGHPCVCRNWIFPAAARSSTTPIMPLWLSIYAGRFQVTEFRAIYVNDISTLQHDNKSPSRGSAWFKK